MVTLAEGSKVPFLVDTGASLSVLSPDFVEQAKARLVAGTEFEVGSSGGTVATRYATARLAFDELVYEMVALALIELPLGGIAGIISPHDLFSRQVVSFDFSEMEMKISSGIDPSDESHMERVPLLMAGGNPHLLARLGGRKPRPLLLDSGSDLTRVSTKLDELGEPLTRNAEVVTMAAGGEYTSWTTQGDVTLVVGNTTWNASNPVVYERSGKQEAEHVGTFGIVGMDFLMGRTLVIDRPNMAILFDRRAQLPRWDVGERRVLEIVGSHFGTMFPVREEVIERDADFVTLEIVVEKPGDVRVFRIRMQDSWNNRSSWLVTRPAAGYWRQEGSEWMEGNPQDVMKDWLPAFMPFQSSGGNAMLEFEVLTTNERESLCSRLRLDAMAKGKDATLSMWDCPGNVWRTTRLEVTDAHSGELLWGFHQSN
jgi:predicted aspartyl protease